MADDSGVACREKKHTSPRVPRPHPRNAIHIAEQLSNSHSAVTNRVMEIVKSPAMLRMVGVLKAAVSRPSRDILRRRPENIEALVEVDPPAHGLAAIEELRGILRATSITIFISASRCNKTRFSLYESSSDGTPNFAT
jgi:hypothetical protein